MRTIAIVGAGSAGLLTAAHLCTWLDNSWQVCVSPQSRARRFWELGRAPTARSSTCSNERPFSQIAQQRDLDALDATVKYGSKFIGWRKHEWINPLLSGNVAIHFNNRRFKDFVFERMSKIWKEQFRVLEADVSHIQNYADHVTVVTATGDTTSTTSSIAAARPRIR